MDDLLTRIDAFLLTERLLGDPIQRYLRRQRYQQERRRPRPTRPTATVVPTPTPARLDPVCPFCAETDTDPTCECPLPSAPAGEAEADHYDQANACPPLDTEAPHDAD